MKKFKLIFLLSLTLLSILGTTSLASGTWDLSEYKKTYEMIAEKADSTFTHYATDQTATNNLFNLVTTTLNNSTYSQESYQNALCYVDFKSTAVTFNFINSTTNNPLATARPAGTIYVQIKLSNKVLGTATVSSISTTSAYYNGNIKYNNEYPDLWNITYQNENYIAQEQTNYYGYRGAELDIVGEDNFNDLYIGTENNYLINRDFTIGKNYNLNNYDFYYIENEQKISIKEYINYDIYNYWWGDIYSFYISQENISNLPNYTEFYTSLEVIAKPSYNTTFNLEKKAFKTTSTGSNIPDNPESGDNGGGGTGGDTGGGTTTPDYSEDLDNIQNGITDINNNLENIENKIPTSEDIAGATTQGNKDFWGNTEDIKEEDFEDQIESEIDGIMETMSGELSQNQIFNELQNAENGFLNFFKEEQDEGFYDLAFNWNEVKLYETTLIPAGGINISQMCRDIESLGYVQTLIRTITCFSVSILIIKQIYNLVLATLGIDNPYLYEDPSMETETIIDMDNDTIYKQYTGRATDGSKYRIKSNHTNIKPKNRIGF